MKIKNLLGAALGVAMGIQSASAYLVADIDFGLPLAYLSVSQNPTYTGTWDLTSQYDPNTQQIVWAAATFLIIDDFDGKSESYSINLGGNGFASGNAGFAFLVGSIQGSALLSLNNTGILTYTITATGGDFYLKEAGLLAEVSSCEPPRRNEVPDGGTTATLLGSALVGLFFVRKKLAAA